MKKLRFTALIFAVCLLLASCGSATGDSYGVLYRNGISESDYRKEIEASKGRVLADYTFFDNLSSMLLALESGRIGIMVVTEPVAKYVCAQNDKMKYELGKGKREYSMAVADNNAELLETLNTAIVSMKNDGTMDVLYADYIENATDKPEPTELATVEGGKTVRVAVTGDLPPLDYTTSDGIPAGFNIELLSEIGRRTGINFETVTTDAASRASMIASGKADVIFWMQTDNRTNPDGSASVIAEKVDGMLLTEAYITVPSAKITLK